MRSQWKPSHSESALIFISITDIQKVSGSLAMSQLSVLSVCFILLMCLSLDDIRPSTALCVHLT